MVPIRAPSFRSHTIQECGAARPARAAGGRAKRALGTFGYFGFVFRIPIAKIPKNKVELSEGPVSGSKIGLFQPVYADTPLPNAMHHKAAPVVPMAPRWPMEAPISTPGPVPPCPTGACSFISTRRNLVRTKTGGR